MGVGCLLQNPKSLVSNNSINCVCVCVCVQEPAWQGWLFAALVAATNRSKKSAGNCEETVWMMGPEEMLIRKLFCMFHVHCVCALRDGWQHVEHTLNFIHLNGDEVRLFLLTKNVHQWGLGFRDPKNPKPFQVCNPILKELDNCRTCGATIMGRICEDSVLGRIIFCTGFNFQLNKEGYQLCKSTGGGACCSQFDWKQRVLITTPESLTLESFLLVWTCPTLC